jgi:CheY-like chemotaxis protein
MSEIQRPAIATVLVVDDDPAVRMVAAAMLEREGYRILQAGSGSEALAIFEAERVDALLSDVQMPGMDGFALVRELRERHPRLPIVLMSGFLSEDSAAQTAFPFLSKPFTPQALSAALRMVIASSSRPERHVA